MQKEFKNIGLSTFFLAVLTSLAFFTPRSNFYATYGLFLLLFGLWFLLVKSDFEFKKLVVLGLLARMILLFATPELSDDFYRFLWDGSFLNESVNPYLFTPKEIMNLSIGNPEFIDLYPKLNSPEYYTVYPTLVQGLNYLSVFVGRSVLGATLVMKGLFVLAEIGIFYFLTKLIPETKNRNILWYWLCPLVLLEFMGNLHHEVWMILFVLGAIYFWRKEQLIWTALFLSLAVFTKLSPLLFVPFFFFRTNKKLQFGLSFVMFSVLFALPLGYQNGYLFFLKSVELYFSSFEFNSSFYKMADALSWFSADVKWMYKALVLVVMSLYFWFWYTRKNTLIYGICGIYLIYLLSAQSVHPWYVLPLLAFYLLEEIPKFYLTWLALIPLTYITYTFVPYQQQLWVNFVEYGMILGFFLFSKSIKPNTFSFS